MFVLAHAGVPALRDGVAEGEDVDDVEGGLALVSGPAGGTHGIGCHGGRV